MGALTTTLTTFLGVFTLGYTNLLPATLSLALMLLAIELVLFGIYFAFGAKNFADIFFKILFIGFWWWIINAFPTLMTMVMNSFVSWGAIAGGTAPAVAQSLMLDPSAIAGFGMTAAAPVIMEMNAFGLTDVGSKILYGLLALIMIGLFFVIAIQVFITVLEFYLVVALTSILLPFAFIKKTAFLAEKAIGAVISFGIKLMVLTFIISIAQPVLAALVLPAGGVTLNGVFALILSVGALAVLTLHAPGIAAGIMSGAPSLTAGSMATTGMAGGMAVAGGATLGAGATAAAARLGSSATQGAARLTGAARSGAAIGSAAGNIGGSSRGGTAGLAVAGAARGVGSALTESTRQGSSNLTSRVTGPIKDSFRQGSRAAAGLPNTSATTSAGSSPSKAPAWTVSSMANLSHAVRYASHSSMPSGGGNNFKV